MDDQSDVLNKLSRLIETQSLGDMTDGDSTAELVAKIGAQIENISVGDTEVTENTLSGSRKVPVVEMPNRKTPFEVWSEKNKTPAKKVRRKEKKGRRRKQC